MSTEELPYKVVVEKEYRKLNKDKPTIGLLMMLKNESKRLHVSLESVVGVVDALIIFDTGSTDNTMEIVKNFSEKHSINLYMIQGGFVDFSTSRNISLDYADKINVHYLLLLDCNDEVKGGENLKKLAVEYFEKPNSAFLVSQQWWSGSLDTYFNVRLVKARNGWRYQGSVHEWMKDTTKDGPDPAHPVLKLPETFFLYQDRTKDDDKSMKRFTRDRELLLKDVENNPKSSRGLFYLAQTCDCLGLLEDALYYSKLRLELGDFEEERFNSYVRCGRITNILKQPWEVSLGWYMQAYEHTRRIEPLVKITEYYISKKKWYIAYMYASEAMRLQFPENLILFVDRGMYNYNRYHLMGIIGWYMFMETGDVKYLKEGKEACLTAIKQGVKSELDARNLKFYLDTERKIENIISKEEPPKEAQKPESQDTPKEAQKPESKDAPSHAPTERAEESKAQFFERKFKELKEKYPGLPNKQIKNRVEKLWKNHI